MALTRFRVAATVAVAATLSLSPVLTRPAAAAERPTVGVAREYICWEVKLPKDPTPAAARPGCDLPVTLSGPVRDKVVVYYRTDPVSAKPDADYVDLTQGEIIIEPGALVGYLRLRIVPDCDKEEDETLGVELVDAVGVDLGDRWSVVTIVDESPGC